MTTVAELAEQARGCTACELYKSGTQTVFGAGDAHARIMLVGEQPGDVEDRAGEPFVGPAGRLLDKALHEAGLDRERLWLTNAVKHFRWQPAPRGKRRIHQKPGMQHVRACHPWLVGELQAVRPEVLVALGATAAQALFGSSFRLTAHRGERLAWPPQRGPFEGSGDSVRTVVATLHPSAVLRGSDEDRAQLYAGLVADLRLAAG
jgi:DNA polymerase